MSTNSYIVENETELTNIAREILQFYQNKNIFTFKGPLGVGKTTFIKYFCRCLGVTTHIQSPSFAIANVYKIDTPTDVKRAASGEEVFHLDLYRIESDAEALEAGLEYYIYNENLCFIEWPEIIVHLLPTSYLAIKMEITEDYNRKITIQENE